jgi:uncharacterized C2H2 Zn-finger protein
MATKKCEVCEADIGETEVKCPKCGVEFSELEETVTAVERANQILEKRRKAKEESEKCKKCGKKHEGDCPPEPKRNKLRGLGAALRGRK